MGLINKSLCTVLLAITATVVSAGEIYKTSIAVDPQGEDFDYYDTRNIAASADGRFVVESAWLPSHIPGLSKIIVTDMQLRQTTNVTGPDGEPITVAQVPVEMSPSGRYIVFNTFLPEASSSMWLYDRLTQETVAVEKSHDGQPLIGCSRSEYDTHNRVKMTFVGDEALYFDSTCRNLVPDATPYQHLYRYDIKTASLELVSRHPLTGEVFNDRSWGVRVSQDEKFMIFGSSASNILPNACPGEGFSGYHYLMNRKTGQILFLNGCSDSGAYRLGSFPSYDLSGDGRYAYLIKTTGRPAVYADGLFIVDTATMQINEIVTQDERMFSGVKGLETSYDGSKVLTKVRGHITSQGAFVYAGYTSAVLFDRESQELTQLSVDIHTGEPWMSGSNIQSHFSLSALGNVLTFGTSWLTDGDRALVNTNMRYGEASAYFYIDLPLAKSTRWMTLRGTFNNWTSIGGGMLLVDHNLWQAEVEFLQPGYFKFDASGNWAVSYGASGITGNAILNGDNIPVTQPGKYRIQFNDATLEYSITRLETEDWQRTLVFMYGETQPGQDMFVRGGIDHGYAQSVLGIDCTASNLLCAIPIRHMNLLNTTTAPWKHGDDHLDWYSAEPGQSTLSQGSPLDWTTNLWPAGWGALRKVDVDGYGETPLNTWGEHYWMLDVEMDCSRTVNGWFELKSFISNGPGWEPDVQQSGAPYASGNHFAQCGKLNTFRRGQNDPVVIRDF